MRILLVEDDAKIATFIAKGLEAGLQLERNIGDGKIFLGRH